MITGGTPILGHLHKIVTIPYYMSYHCRRFLASQVFGDKLEPEGADTSLKVVPSGYLT